jgi:HK97 gp10 family phage protein
MDKNLKGYEKLVKQLNAIAEANYTPALVKGVTQAILPTMQSLTPVDTGELLESEGVEVNNDTVSLFAKAPHAAPVELGTVHMKAQPYMQPAIDTRKDEALRITAEEVENIMLKAIR